MMDTPPLPPLPNKPTDKEKRNMKWTALAYGCLLIILAAILILSWDFQQGMHETYYKYLK
jgi:uncharacterized integral membrane protein